MTTPRRAQEEFQRLRSCLEDRAGSTGVAEYVRILREFGVERPQQFKTSQVARLCAKRIYELIEELSEQGAERPNSTLIGAANSGEEAEEGAYVD